MFSSSHIMKGELKLCRVTELYIMYKDAIAPESHGDIQTAKDFASGIREEYEAAMDGNFLLNMGTRIRLARRFNRAASQALDRTKHITDMALRIPQRKECACRDTAGPIVEAIVEPRNPNSEDNDLHLDGPSSCNEVAGEQDEHSSEDESVSSRKTGEQSAKYGTVELKITTCDKQRIVGMKLRNLSNPELSVEGDCIRFGRAHH